MDKLYNIARALRKNQTPQEKKLWNILKNRQFENLKFKRQVPFGKYIADFFCESQKLIIEIDGGQHNENENIIKDIERTKYFEKEGYRVIRFWNNEIDNNLDGVYLKLKSVIK